MTEFAIDHPGGGKRWIGDGHPCFVIAEIGTNWCLGDRHDDRHARRLIELAGEAGCDAVKYQTFTPQYVYAPNAGESDYLRNAGIRASIHEVIGERVMPPEMVEPLARHAAAHGLVFMSSCFSTADLELIDPLTPIHKLASYEISHRGLIDAIAATGKALIMSTGAANEDDVAWAVDRFRSHGGGPLALLQCTAAYPAPDDALNLRSILRLAARFEAVTGLSDHSRAPLTAPVAAVALGAAIIEKHVTLDRSGDGPDHFNSIEPSELAEMVQAVRATEAMLGDGRKTVLPAEVELHRFARRRVQTTRAVEAGEELREGVNVAILRPGKRSPGAHPRELDRIEGTRARVAIAAGDGVRLEDIER